LSMKSCAGRGQSRRTGFRRIKAAPPLTQVILNGDGLRLQQLAMGQQHA
jgi:hypothetical protein